MLAALAATGLVPDDAPLAEDEQIVLVAAAEMSAEEVAEYGDALDRPFDDVEEEGDEFVDSPGSRPPPPRATVEPVVGVMLEF